MQWKNYLKIIIRLGSLVAFIFVVRWLSWKGMLGMLLGMAFVTYLFMSKNTMLMAIVSMFDDGSVENYTDMMRGKQQNGKERKKPEALDR